MIYVNKIFKKTKSAYRMNLFFFGFFNYNRMRYCVWVWTVD